MRFIGITGGIGAGKSEILHFIEKEYPARILLADELAHQLMQPGGICFPKIRELFGGEDIFLPSGGLDPVRVSEMIFRDKQKLEKLNRIVHPAVKREIIRIAEAERAAGTISYLILEAALLIEEGYGKICDELWLIDTSEKNRRIRLKETRGYSDEKIDAVFANQLSEEAYRTHCSIVIDNNGSLEEACRQVKAAFARLEPKKDV